MNIYLFYCSNCLDTHELRQSLGSCGHEGVKTVSLSCSGKVNLLYLLKAFEKGADGLILVTCPQNDCHYLEGNLRAQKRSNAVNAMLDEIGFGKGCIKVIQKAKEEGVEPIITALEALNRSPI